MEDDPLDIREERTPSQSLPDLQQEEQLCPSHFDDFRGQEYVADDLKVFVKAAHRRDEAFDHVLLYGPPGLGRMTLSHITSHGLGIGMKITSGPVSEKAGDLAGLFTSLEPHDVLFIGGIHRLSHIVEEYLYSAMGDFRVGLMINKGPRTHSIQIDLNPFTLAGVTTCSGLLTVPLQNRFGISLRLKHHDMDTPADIALCLTRILEAPCEGEAVQGIVLRSRDTPRIANALLKRMRDFVQVRSSGMIDSNITAVALEVLHIDKHGLNHVDHKSLKTIIDKFDGGPVGLSTIATAMGEDPGMIGGMYKPFLIQEGFVQRTRTGRQVIRLAYARLGRTYRQDLPPEVSLFD